jgi:hypothetical protein
MDVHKVPASIVVDLIWDKRASHEVAKEGADWGPDAQFANPALAPTHPLQIRTGAVPADIITKPHHNSMNFGINFGGHGGPSIQFGLGAPAVSVATGASHLPAGQSAGPPDAFVLV